MQKFTCGCGVRVTLAPFNGTTYHCRTCGTKAEVQNGILSVYHAGFSGGINLREPKQPEQLPESIVAAPIEGWRVWKILQPDATTLNMATLRELSAAYERGENPFARLLLPSLGSIGRDHRWSTNEQATCLAYSQTNPFAQPFAGCAHDAPAPYCTCGIWALTNREDAKATVVEYAASSGPLLNYAYGRVQLWGKVIRCKRGYRAQHARPLDVLLLSQDEEAAAGIAQRYGCEVRCDADELPRMREAHQRAQLERAKREREAYEKMFNLALALQKNGRGLQKRRGFPWSKGDKP